MDAQVNKQQELAAFEDRWNEAIVSNMPEMIAAFMANDWVIVGTEGGITGKAAFLGEVIAGNLTHSRMDSDERHVQIYGDVGVVISKGTSAGAYLGKPFSFYEWSMSVFVFRNGQWQCVTSMLTPALQK